MLLWLLVLLILLAGIARWFQRRWTDWAVNLHLTIVGALGLTGLILTRGILKPSFYDVTFAYVVGYFLLSLAAAGLLLGLVEFGLLRVLGLFRVGAIARVTYYEALLQPFTIILIVAGIAIIAISARYPYFTYDEDFKMYRDVASSFLFLCTLPIMIFASTKVIDEEIENRTMLTLMSKPVARWQVVIGKYLGVLLLVLVVLVTLAIFAGSCGYLRFYDDKLIDFRLAGPTTTPAFQALALENDKAVLALFPSVVLQFLQLASLAAISVAVSTRFGLAVNVTVIVVIYMAANLAPYAQATPLPQPVGAIISAVSYLLPDLARLDLNPRLIFGDYLLPHEYLPRTPTYGAIWSYVAIASVYALCYIGAALSLGVALFRTRELA